MPENAEARNETRNDTQFVALDHTIQVTNIWLKKLAGDHRLEDASHA